MSRPAIVVLGALGVIALAVVLGAFSLRHKPPQPSSVEKGDTVANVPLAMDPDAASRPLPPTPAPAPSPKSSAHHRQPVGKDAVVTLDEPSLLAKLHDLAASNPPLSLQLAREAVARFPDSPDAPEFEWNVVKSLANMERFKEAQEEARVMVKKYPSTSWASDVQRHLLSNPLE
jgi:hypothetical protein